MDCFLKEIHYYLFYYWCKNHIFYNQKYQEKRDVNLHQILQHNDQLVITLSFWDHHIIEEQIVDITTGKIVFYMHFEFINLYQAQGLTMDFASHIHKLSTEKKILIVCSCGITSSLFADDLKTQVKQHNLNYTVDAINLHSLETVIENYDYVCLAPQIRHLIPTLIPKHRNKIIAIDTGIFATSDSHALLYTLLK